MSSSTKAYRVCCSTRKIVSIDYVPVYNDGAARVEVYKVRYWDMGEGIDYEMQKIADVYPASLEQLENIVHCFGIVWQCTETFEDALDILSETYYQSMNEGIGAISRKPLAAF